MLLMSLTKSVLTKPNKNKRIQQVQKKVKEGSGPITIYNMKRVKG